MPPQWYRQGSTIPAVPPSSVQHRASETTHMGTAHCHAIIGPSQHAPPADIKPERLRTARVWVCLIRSLQDERRYSCVSPTHEFGKSLDADQRRRSVDVEVGNFNSKSTLAYEDHGVMQLCVVEYLGPWDNPDRPKLPNYSLNEFTGRGGLDKNGEVVVGKPALESDLNFSIKAVVIHVSVGVSDPRVMQKAPDGLELLAAVQDHLVTKDQLHEMVRKHISFLWKMIKQVATKEELDITRIGLSHPSFLAEDKAAQHFELYTEYLEKVARKVIGDDYEYYAVSEGQATGNYICERFRADVHGMYKHYIEELFEGMDTSERLPLVIYDGGSSTLVCPLLCSTHLHGGDYCKIPHRASRCNS